MRHEQGATHAADGYARATGRPGVVLVTSGPGATNAVTGIATAYLDSIPLVVFTGQVATHMIGNDAFQEVDSMGITRPCVKHNFLVKDVKDLAAIIKKAFYVATSGRPGPVVVDLPKDITADSCEYEYPQEVELRSYRPVVKGHPGQIKKAAKLLLSAKKPMIYSGGGVVLSEASNELTEFSRLLGYPVTNTLMGLGAFPATDKQFVGMLGMHGTYEANMGMHHCDLLIAIGARFDYTGRYASFPPGVTIVKIDIDPSSIAKNVPVDVPIVGDVRHVLSDLISVLKNEKENPNIKALEDWWKQINDWKDLDCLKFDRTTDVIKPQYVVEKLWELTKGDAYVTSDVGQHQMWAAQYLGFEDPHRWINSGGLGTMGFGLPAAMGCKRAFPDTDVACVTGEGSIQKCVYKSFQHVNNLTCL